MENNKKSFGLKIAYYRTQYGYTQEEFAKIMGISVPTLRNYEHERMVPDCEFLAKFSLLFDISPEVLLNMDINEFKTMTTQMFPDGAMMSDEEKKSIMDELMKRFAEI